MRLEKYSQPPYSVSSDFGQLAASRHLISGLDCAIAGAATADAARPKPAACRNSRRFMAFPLLCRTARARGHRADRICRERSTPEAYRTICRLGKKIRD